MSRVVQELEIHEGDLDPLAAAQLRHPLARSRRQPAADPAVPRTQLAADDDGLPPSDHGEPGAGGRPDRGLDGALTDADRRRRAAAVRRGVSRAVRRDHARGAQEGAATRSPRAAPAQLGTVLYACESCGRTHAVGRSCGNRHCPTCQQDKTRAWLENADRPPAAVPLLPGHLHAAGGAARLARSHQRMVYAALFEASSAALRTLAADPKFVGTDRLGFFGVLHTWGRTLEYHPHVHYVVPGGGLSADGSCWLPSRADFLVPVEALSIIFRAKFRDVLEREGLLNLVDPAVWRRDWVVHSQAAGDGRASLAVSGSVRLPRGDRRPSHRLVRRWQGHVHAIVASARTGRGR